MNLSVQMHTFVYMSIRYFEFVPAWLPIDQSTHSFKKKKKLVSFQTVLETGIGGTKIWGMFAYPHLNSTGIDVINIFKKQILNMSTS